MGDPDKATNVCIDDTITQNLKDVFDLARDEKMRPECAADSLANARLDNMNREEGEK